MGLFKCAAYLAAAGAASFVLGRAVPPAWFREPRGPFRCFPFEQEGRLYERAGVKRWQGKLPDMSRILPGALPPKRVGPDGARDLSEMLRETCVAELAHWVYSSIKKSTFRSAGFRHFAGKRRRTSHPSLPISRASAPRPSSCSGR